MWTWNSDDIRITPLERADAADVLDQSWNPGDLHAFIKIPGLPISLSMAKYPVTNAQYSRFLLPENFTNQKLWTGFPKFSALDDQGKVTAMNDWGNKGWNWLQGVLKEKKEFVKKNVLYPRSWRNARFGVARPSAPVVAITWWEANAYCQWLLMHWDELEEGKHDLPKPKQLRLPTETEWMLAAGGKHPQNRYAWDAPDQATTNLYEILQRANIIDSKIVRTTPVWMYPLGATPEGVMDMAGNIWEWQANFRDPDERYIGLRGGSWIYERVHARVNFSSSLPPVSCNLDVGFRVVALPG